MASNNRIEVLRGDTCRFQVTITDDTNFPVVLTSATIYFTVRRRYSNGADDADAVFQKSVGSGITITNAAGGIIDLVISAADTINLPASVLLYDLQVTTQAGDVCTAALGQFAIAADVTRRGA